VIGTPLPFQGGRGVVGDRHLLLAVRSGEVYIAIRADVGQPSRPSPFAPNLGGNRRGWGWSRAPCPRTAQESEDDHAPQSAYADELQALLLQLITQTSTG